MAQDFEIIDRLPSMGYTPGGQGTPDPFGQAMDEALRKAPAGFTMTNESVDAQRAARPENFLYSSTSGGTGTLGSSSSGNSGVFGTLQSQLDLLGKTVDPLEKQKILVGIEASTGEYITNKAKEARIQAESDLGLEALRNQIAVNERLDRADPKWEQMQSDSRITQAARQKLAQAEAAVDIHAKRLLGEDGELARFVKTVDGTLALQRGLIQKAEINDLNKAKTLEQKAENLAALIASVPTEVRTSFMKENPALANDETFGAFLVQAAKGGKDRDSIDALMTGAVRPENYIQAGMAGNGLALRLAAAEQADRTGLPKEVVQKHIQSAFNLTQDPTKFLQAAPALGIPAKEIKKMQSDLQLGGKDAAKAFKEKASGYVDQYLSLIQKQEVDTNVLGWKAGVGEPSIDQAPGAATAIQNVQARTGNPKVSVDDFAKEYLSQPGLSKQEQAMRMGLLGDAYVRTLERTRSGIYGKDIDAVGAVNALLVKNALRVAQSGNMAQQVGASIAEGTDAALAYQSPITRLLGAGARTAGGTLADVYRGFTGGNQ